MRRPRWTGARGSLDCASTAGECPDADRKFRHHLRRHQQDFHWLTALLILANLPLGWFATQLAEEIAATGGSDALVARATLLFSIHKTTGVAIFLVALARILWALTQTKPGLLNGDTAVEARAAETAHWLLYGSLVAVPLSGWVHHAATTGYAPIWWPLGQSLPFVPKSEAVAEIAATLHFLFILVLAGALAAHVAGALKHHLIDGDATLRRMLPGRFRPRRRRGSRGTACPSSPRSPSGPPRSAGRRRSACSKSLMRRPPRRSQRSRATGRCRTGASTSRSGRWARR